MSFITDTYTDIAGTSITSHTSENGGPVVANTAFAGSAAAITAANRLRADFSGNTIMTYTGSSSTADYDVEADVYVATISTAVGLIGRASTTAGTYYLLDYETGSLAWKLYAIVAGSNVATASFSQTLTIGATYHVKLSMRGTTITGSVNGSVVLTIVDNNITGIGKAGFFFGGAQTNSTGFHLDNFSGTTANLFAVTDTNIFFSPGNWDSDGTGDIQSNNILPSSTYARTENPGAYIKLAVNAASNGEVKLNLDTTPLNGVTVANCPRIAVSVDGGALSTTLLAYSPALQQITLGSGLSAGNHSVIVWFQGVTQNSSLAMGDRWTTLTTGASVVKTVGIELDALSTIAAPTIKPLKMLVYGDSITEGCDSVGSANGPGDQDATITYAVQLANRFNAEVGIIGWASQGYEQVGYGNVPVLSSSYNKYSSGRNRVFINYDIILDDHGTNGTTTSSDVTTMLGNYRLVCPNAVIFKIVPFGQAAASAIKTGVTNYQIAHPSDNKVFLIDTGVNYVNGTNSNDNLHPNFTGHTLYANDIGIIMADYFPLKSQIDATPTMFYPNGGEEILSNEVVIAWTPANFGSSVELFYSTNYSPFDQNWQQIAVLPSTVNSFTWRFGNSIRSDRCRVGIRTRNINGERSIISASAANFSIHRKKLEPPTLISPVQSGRYSKFVEIVTDDSGIVGTYSQRSFYQFFYSSQSANVPSTPIAQDVPIGGDPIVWDITGIQPASDYVVQAYLQDDVGNVSDSTYISNIEITHEGFFIVDTIAPVASVLVNNGDIFTRFREVNVSIVAYDAATAVHSMLLKDQTNAGSPEALANIKRFVLSDKNEIKAVQLLLQDFGANRNDELQIIQRVFEVVVELSNTEIADLAVDLVNQVCWVITQGDFKNLYRVTDFPSLLTTFEDTPTAVEVFQSLTYIATKSSDNAGALYRFDGVETTLIEAFTGADSFVNTMCSHNGKMYIGMENGNIWSYNGLTFTFIQTMNSPTKLLYSDGNILYLALKNDLKVYIYGRG